MREYPTLGGLKKLQKFLEKQDFPMSIFAMDIYRDKRSATSGSGWSAGKGTVASIDGEIKDMSESIEKPIRLRRKR